MLWCVGPPLCESAGMKIRRSVITMLTLVGCGDADPVVTDETVQPVIVAATPYVVALNYTPLPALAVRGRLPEATSYADTSRNAAHQAQHTDGTNLADPPLYEPGSTAGSRDTWASNIGAITDGRYLQPPAFSTRLQAALVQANAHMAELDTSILHDAAELFSYIPDVVTHVDDSPNEEFVAWPQPRARWLDSQWARGPGARPYAPEVHYKYPTPAGLEAFEDRGARLYCAARTVAFNQHKGSLGEQVLLPLTILGENLDIGVFEPTAYVNKPEKVGDPSSADGVNAFNIPLLLGVNITPIRNLLPPLPELRYPLVLTAEDSEMVDDVSRGLIHEDQFCRVFVGVMICVPIVRIDYRFRYKTVAHVDTALSAGQGMSVTANFPIFWAGPLLVELGLEFGATVGKQIDRSGDFGGVPARPAVYDDRLMVVSPTPLGWPGTIRQTGTSDVYKDGYWHSLQNIFPGDPGVEAFDIRRIDADGTDSDEGTIGLGPTNRFRAAALADDDHHIARMSELGLAGSITGTVGINISVASITFSASGAIGGVLGLAHDTRDAISVAPAELSGTPVPVAGVTVTPITYVGIGLHFNVKVDLVIPLLFTTIRAHYDFIDKDVPLGSKQSLWSEDHRLRIATDSQEGDVTQSHAYSHIAGGATFESFPESIAACLADLRESPPVPDRCESPPPTHVVPHVRACFYTEISAQFDPCLHIPTIGSTAADRCEIAKLRYMCKTTMKEQFFAGQLVLAHKMGFDTNDDDLTSLAALGDACVAAAREADPSFKIDEDSVSAWFSSIYKIAPCDATATLSTAADAIKVGDPGPVSSGSCH